MQIKIQKKWGVIMADKERQVTLVDEDGKEHEFTVLDVIQMKDNEYAVLLPAEEEEEAIILKFSKDDEGNEILVDIEDDEEWEKVADTWEEMVVERENS